MSNSLWSATLLEATRTLLEAARTVFPPRQDCGLGEFDGEPGLMLHDGKLRLAVTRTIMRSGTRVCYRRIFVPLDEILSSCGDGFGYLQAMEELARQIDDAGLSSLTSDCLRTTLLP
jgi:hypothetical protein